MEYKYDVVIVGAGGAGLNLACLLSEYKLKICLIDSKKDLLNLSFHTLGSFIDIKKFKLSDKVIASTVTEAILSSSHFHFKKRGKAFIINKLQLHKELLDRAIKNKINIKTSSMITSCQQNGKGNIEFVKDINGNKYYASIFVDTSGVQGILSKKLGLQDKYLKTATGLEYNVEYFGLQEQCHFFFGKLCAGGYGWIFPLGSHRAILGIGSYNNLVRSELKARLNEMSEINRIKKLVKIDNPKLYGGTIPISSVKTKFIYNNLVCLGDSVSQVNPLVGEGYQFIFESGYIAAPYIYQAIQNNDILILKNYEKDWSKMFYKKYRLAYFIQKLANFASKNDFLSDCFALLFSTKSDKTFTEIISGNITLRNIFLP